MCDSDPLPALGQIVKILRGKEANHYSVVVGVIDDKFVNIADGKRHKFHEPKKKNMIHLKFENFISQEVSEGITTKGSVPSRKLRIAIEKFLEQTTINGNEHT